MEYNLRGNFKLANESEWLVCELNPIALIFNIPTLGMVVAVTEEFAHVWPLWAIRFTTAVPHLDRGWRPHQRLTTRKRLQLRVPNRSSQMLTTPDAKASARPLA